MFKKLKTKSINWVISVLALILLLPLIISNYIFARSQFNENYQDDGMIYGPMMVKYGGIPAPFDILLLKLRKIYGTIRSKETKLPLSGMKVKITKPEIQVLSDESGYFAFELYNLIYDTFEIEIRDGKSGILLQTCEVIFPAEKNYKANFIDYQGEKSNTQEKKFEIKEETLEIFI